MALVEAQPVEASVSQTIVERNQMIAQLAGRAYALAWDQAIEFGVFELFDKSTEGLRRALALGLTMADSGNTEQEIAQEVVALLTASELEAIDG